MPGGQESAGELRRWDLYPSGSSGLGTTQRLGEQMSWRSGYLDYSNVPRSVDFTIEAWWSTGDGVIG